MWQNCYLTAVQRKTTFVEQSWWPELSLFGSRPLCSFPRQKLLPKLAQKNCHTTLWIYPWKTTSTLADSILVSDQTDLFSFTTHGDEYGMPGKALPWKQAKVDTGHQILPGLTQGSFQIKELDRTTIKLLLKWMLVERWRRPSMLSSMRQHVTRLQFDRHQTGSFQFARCRSAFPDDRLLDWRSGSEVEMSSHNHSMPSSNLMNIPC